jgi:hypothetical protein
MEAPPRYRHWHLKVYACRSGVATATYSAMAGWILMQAEDGPAWSYFFDRQ